MRFELRDGTTTKFWEVLQAGAKLTQRWGKVGGSTNERVAELASMEAAEKQLNKLVREKQQLGYVAAGGKKVATKIAAAPPKTSVDPKELVVTRLAAPGRSRLSRIAIDGTRMLAAGDSAVASTDGKKLWGRTSPGRLWALAAIDGVLYGAGFYVHVSRDFGESWTEVGLPHDEYFSIMRDTKGTWWLGKGDGTVMSSKNPTKGWKKAFAGHGRVLWIQEVDDKLFCCGPDPGVWDGKKYARLKGMKKTDVLTRIVASPNGTLIAIGDAAVVYRSENRGTSWQPVKVPVKGQDLEDCAWVAGALYVVGGAGTLLVSTNDGKTFKKVAVPGVTYEKLWGIASWGDGAFLAGDNATMLKLASPKDTYWKGTKDELAPKPPEIDATFVAAVAASRETEYAKLAAAAAAAYEPTEDTRPAAPNPELAKLVDAADDATGALGVYADWLQAQGDPRGELAVVQLQRAEAPKDKPLAKAEKALLKQHGPALLGSLAEIPDVVQIAWRGGFIHTARVANSMERDPDYGDGDEASAVDIEAIVPQLLDHPSARFMRGLTVGIVTFEDNDYGNIAKAIGKRHLPALRDLYLGDFIGEETEISWSHLGKLQPIYAAVPNLRTLRLRSGSMDLGKIIHPTLESFDVMTGGLDPKTTRQIATAQWPNLRSLMLAVGREHYGGTTKIKDLQPILDGVGLPRLTTLGLRNLEYTDAVIEPLAKSKILPQLRVLDLGMGTLSDEGVRRIFRFQKAFRHLERIDVSSSFVTKAGLKLLASLKVAITSDRQRDDAGDPSRRYAAVGE